jgi:GxxExxY protein
MTNKLIYPELSYKINGIIFEVHNELGGSHLEKYYQKAIAIKLKKYNIQFVEQYYIPLMVENQIIGKYFLDFLIEDKIVLELKRGRYIPRNVYYQTNKYLQTLNLHLAIVACFATDVAVIKRIINQ